MVFLLAVKGVDETDSLSNKRPNSTFADYYGLKALRTAEVVQILDKDGRIIRPGDNQNNRGDNRRRRIHVKLDAAMYKVC